MTQTISKGPWILRDETLSDRGGYDVDAFIDGETVTVAQCENGVNGRAIAAVPDMIEALEIAASGNTDPDRVAEIAQAALDRAVQS